MPCRNEAKNLPRVLQQIPNFVDQIIVVDNGSTDDTVEIARKYSAQVIKENRAQHGIGYGFAHMRGLAAATGDIIVGCDSDGQHPLKDMGKMLDFLIDQEIDFLSCSRYQRQHIASIPLRLRVGVKLLNMEVYLLYGVKVQDILSGMWVLKKSSRSKLVLTEGDWNLSPQIKIAAATHPKIVFAEYAIKQKARQGSSHQQYLSSGMRHAWWILKNRFVGRSALGRPKVKI